MKLHVFVIALVVVILLSGCNRFAMDESKRKYGGTGLGLPITRNIIEMMGGSLMVESAYGYAYARNGWDRGV
jgi:hypothetical protein